MESVVTYRRPPSDEVSRMTDQEMHAYRVAKGAFDEALRGLGYSKQYEREDVEFWRHP